MSTLKVPFRTQFAFDVEYSTFSVRASHFGRVAESGLRHSTRNRAWGNPPWVRIPPLPLLIKSAGNFGTFLELWASQAVVRICDAISCCARAAGRACVVLSQSRAQTRTPSRDFAATAVWNRVSIAAVAIPPADAKRSRVVCRGDVSGLLVREVQLSNAAPSS